MKPKELFSLYETVKVVSCTPDYLILRPEEERRKKEGIEEILIGPWCSELGAFTGLYYRPLIDRNQLIGRKAEVLNVGSNDMYLKVEGLGEIRAFTCRYDESFLRLCFERVERE